MGDEEGTVVGVIDGWVLGPVEAAIVGNKEGTMVGVIDGRIDGWVLGEQKAYVLKKWGLLANMKEQDWAPAKIGLSLDR